MRKKRIVWIALALLAFGACKKPAAAPRETIGLVKSIVEDTTGLRSLAASAGWMGADGSITLLGDPEEVVLLSRRFQEVDARDNVDGRHKPDSLPDFAGEHFEALLDVYNAPYSHFVGSSLDSLREVAVRGALHAWDTVSYRSPSDSRGLLKKESAKILILTSSLQAEFGLFDVDTLQQLVGGKCRVLSPVEILLDSVFSRSGQNVAVWTSDPVRETEVWNLAFGRKHAEDATLSVYTPEEAVDVRTRLRDLLRQYQVTGLPLDALIVDSYQVNIGPLQSELALIRLCGTEEDAAFDAMLSKDFRFLQPSDALIEHTYNILREENLFAHRVARPQVKYYESAESESGEIVLVEAAASYVKKAYVCE